PHVELDLERPVTRSPSIGITLRTHRRTAEPLLVLSLKSAVSTDSALGAAAPVRRRTIRHSCSFGNTEHSSALDYPPFSMDTVADSLVPMTPPSTSDIGSQNRDMLSIPATDSKYNSHTIVARSGDHRRAQMQRRKTDNVYVPSSIQRPATAHASTTARKITYSQYPDFETIKDPFAKRDKIPRRSEHPFAINTASTDAPPMPTALVSNKQGARGGGSRNVPQTPVSAPILHAEDHAVPVFSPHASSQPETELSVPTPLRKHDKIPRHAPPHSRRESEPLQMELLEMQFPESPVTPKQQVTANKRSSVKPPLPPTMTMMLSPITPGSHMRPSRVPAAGHDAVMIPQRKESRPANIEMMPIKSPARTISGHNISPRLQIDMNNVDKLYARRSLIFENKIKRESKVVRSASRMRSPLAATLEEEAPRRQEPLLRSQTQGTVSKTANRQSYSSEYDEDDDKESVHYIPFDQVLIPTAFKRLRKALEDPQFEVDEETYHRFKLSERWYAREERRQEDRSANKAAADGSKQREAATKNTLSNNVANPMLVADNDTRTPSAHKRLPQPESEVELVAIPARTRTVSKQPTTHDSALDAHQGMSCPDDNDYRPSDSTMRTAPSGYVPPATPAMRYTNSQQIRDDLPSDSHKLEKMHANKHHHRDRQQTVHAAPASAEQSSSACCGCTIM
ncbi:hypothetical protein IWW35_004197, partial [Coemansia sp. RSA 1878]